MNAGPVQHARARRSSLYATYYRSASAKARSGAPPMLLSAATMVRTVFATSASEATLIATAPARAAAAVPAGTTRI